MIKAMMEGRSHLVAKERNMEGRLNYFRSFGNFVHKHFLVLLLAAYAAAGFWPWLGIATREITLAQFDVLHESMSMTLPMLLLGGLLFNAGLGADAADLAQVVKKPRVVLAGLATNVFVPVVFLLLAFQVLRFWHDPDEVQNLFLGLAVVAAMPVAGSSTAWSQNANGNVALSLGLVVLSTLLCPVTTPLTLFAFESVTTGGYAEALRQMSGQGTWAFLLLCVVIPSLAGLTVRYLLGGKRISLVKPWLKIANSMVLLFLCYANASTALPQMIADPDWDFLGVILVIVITLCLSAFMAGWLLARFLRLDEPQQRSLMFGLGMNNNGTGMVLACAALSSMPLALLPVLAYNLVQHLVAGGVDWTFRANRCI
jgi:BASS family bile acid:Na+ symporter